MPTTSTPLRIPITGALRHPGSSQAVDTSAELPGLAGVAAEVAGSVKVDVLLERVAEGIVVRGMIGAGWSAACSRCLEPVEGLVSVHVDELFERAPLEGETYPLADDAIDLEPMVRDSLLLELPAAPLCGPDCAGLCPTCGVNHNVTGCDCNHDEIDPRWAALRSLEL